MKLFYLSALIFLSLCSACADTEDSSTSNQVPASPSLNDDSTPPDPSPGEDPANNEANSNDDLDPNYDATTFPLALEAGGLHFFGRVGVTHDFLTNVTKAYEAMLVDGPSINSEMRTRYLAATAAQNCFQLVGLQGPENYPGTMNARPGGLYQHHSIDYIWQLNEGGGSQIGEVLEHLLHTVTAVGMKLAFHDAWDFSDTSSPLTLAMQEAVDKGIYEISSYADLLAHDPEGYHTVLATEYVYWLILAEWDYFVIADKKEPGMSGNGEFTLGTSAEIAAELPVGHQFYQTHVAPVLSKPDAQLIQSLFP